MMRTDPLVYISSQLSQDVQRVNADRLGPNSAQCRNLMAYLPQSDAIIYKLHKCGFVPCDHGSPGSVSM